MRRYECGQNEQEGDTVMWGKERWRGASMEVASEECQ